MPGGTVPDVDGAASSNARSPLRCLFANAQLELRSQSLTPSNSHELGVTAQTLRNWELNLTKVQIRYYPNILALIGDVPNDASLTLGARCRAQRQKRGLSAKRLALLAGVDEATIRRLEADTPRMARKTVAKILTHLEV